MPTQLGSARPRRQEQGRDEQEVHAEEGERGIPDALDGIDVADGELGDGDRKRGGVEDAQGRGELREGR